jgi:hypothetical protein
LQLRGFIVDVVFIFDSYALTRLFSGS